LRMSGFESRSDVVRRVRRGREKFLKEIYS